MMVKQSHQLWLDDSLGVRELKEFADKVSILILKSPVSALFVASEDTI
jgi:hypothetical protein